MSLPGLPPKSKKGICGFTFNPPLAMSTGMSAKCRADIVIKPGVGIPSGVIGTPAMDLHLPKQKQFSIGWRSVIGEFWVCSSRRYAGDFACFRGGDCANE